LEKRLSSGSLFLILVSNLQPVALNKKLTISVWVKIILTDYCDRWHEEDKKKEKFSLNLLI